MPAIERKDVVIIRDKPVIIEEGDSVVVLEVFEGAFAGWDRGQFGGWLTSLSLRRR